MHRLLRAVLVWIMAIAVPVQGMASSSMMSCGPSHERVMQVLAGDAPASAPGHATRLVHDMMAMGHDLHAHPDSAHGVAHGTAVGVDGNDLSDLFPHHGNFSCSADAACCSVLALPADFALPPPLGPEDLTPMSPVFPLTSHQPDGLDRPPRTILA